MEEIICNRSHVMVAINDGRGNNKESTRCNLCNLSNTNDFLSCVECNYDLCYECQVEQVEHFEKNKANEDCHYDEKYLKYIEGHLDSTACLSECGRESNGYMLCRCGKKYCMNCYFITFPEDERKYDIKGNLTGRIGKNHTDNYNSRPKTNRSTKNSSTEDAKTLGKKAEQCHHEKNKFKYNPGHLGLVCIGGCERESDGFLECSCGKKLCVVCYEVLFQEDKGKYTFKMAPTNNHCSHKKENLTYNLGKLSSISCMYACGRESDGYVECICNQSICLSCYEAKYPEDKGKFGIFLRETRNSVKTQTATNKVNRILEEKADIDSVKIGGHNFSGLKCSMGHELVYSKNINNNECTKCGGQSIVIWSCKKCNYHHCKYCIEDLDQKNKCICCIII